MKPLITEEEMIKKLKEKNITFNYTSEEDAIKYLTYNNNYFNLTSYRKNFDKNLSGKYKNLDFDALVDMSKIDMYLRFILLKMTINIEHYIKINLLKKIKDNPYDDGYISVRNFILNNDKIFDEFDRKKSSPYVGDIINKYNINSDDKTFYDIPAWAFFEIISFGYLISFYDFYLTEYFKTSNIKYDLWKVKDIRNACAHNSCLINDLTKSNTIHDPSDELRQYISRIDGISKTTRDNKLTNYRLIEIATTFMIYKEFVTSKSIVKYQKEELLNLFQGRMLENAFLYKKNKVIKSSYYFILEIIKNM